MTKYYESGAEHIDDIMNDVLASLELEAEREIFVVKVLGQNEEDLTIDVVVAFTDKEMMRVDIGLNFEHDGVAVTVQGHYL